MKFQLKTDEWIYAVLLLSFVVFWLGYKVVIQPIQNEDRTVPAFMEAPKSVEALPATIRPVAQTRPNLPAPRKLTPVQERLQKAGFDPFTVHPVSVK